MEGSELFEIGRNIYRELWALKNVIPNSFPPLTCPISNIPVFEYIPIENRHRSLTEKNEHTEAWRSVTSNYSLSVIEKYVRLYSNPDDQLELIDRILRTIPLEKNTSVEEFLMNLVDRIKAGNFDTDESTCFIHSSISFELIELARSTAAISDAVTINIG